MNEIITPPNIVFTVGMIGILFSIYRYFKEPQIKSDKKESILSLEIQQLKQEILDLKKETINLKDNHIHALQMAIENTNSNVNSLTVQVAKLATIVDERVPKK